MRITATGMARASASVQSLNCCSRIISFRIFQGCVLLPNMTKIVRILVTVLQQTFIIYVVCLARSPESSEETSPLVFLLVLPLSSCSILSFPQGHSVAAYVFLIVFSSLLSFIQWRGLGGSSYANGHQTFLTNM